MGIVGSKDETGKIVLGSLPPGFLDYKGRDLRDKLDECLERSMWMFTLGGLAITIPICYAYKTTRPLMAAAVTCPVLDLMYGTVRCEPEKQAFLDHYREMQRAYQLQHQQLSGDASSAHGKGGGGG